MSAEFVDAAFRDEVRRFLEEALTPDIRVAQARQAGVFGEDLKRWMQVEYALVLILVMLLRPHGLLSRRARPARPAPARGTP